MAKKPAAATGTEVVETKDAGVPVTVKQIVPGIKVLDDDMAAELEGVEGAGRSDRAEDRGTPLLYIAQKMSPQVDKKQAAAYIEGLEVGNVFNSVTKEFYDAEGDGLEILPCYYRVNWNEWTPRDEGGGFHGSHPRDTDLLKHAKPFVDKNGKVRRDIFVMDNGHELRLTSHYFCILPQTWRPIIIPMASSNLGAARVLQGMIDAQLVQVGERIVPAPGFWTRYLLSTAFKEFDEGNAYTYVVRSLGPNDNKALREHCKAFALACKNNEVKVAQPVDDGTASEGSVGDKDIPV